MTALLDVALAWQAFGYAPVPTCTDGTKAPAVKWARYNENHITCTDVRTDFARVNADGFGIICGDASKNLEMFEVEGRAAHLTPEIAQLMNDNGFGDLWERINTGYVLTSPSGGTHWHYTISDGPSRPNTKLAKNPDGLVMIETRGLGGFTVVDPSGGRTHPSGLPWVATRGNMTTIPAITSEERDDLYYVAATFDRSPVVSEPARGVTTGSTHTRDDGLRPGDDYNNRARWADILQGWTLVRTKGRYCEWRRPGKNSGSISATTGTNDGDNIYVFSTSVDIDPETPHSKFAYYTHTLHHGDYSAAAKALRALGYGTQPSRAVTTPDNPFGAIGNLATIHTLPTPAERPITIVAERTLTHSDDGNALALIDRFGDQIRFCSDRGRWYAWDGHTWTQCHTTSGIAREYAKRVARALPEATPPEVAHKKRTLSAPGISAMLQQAASDDRISVTSDMLDAHPYELNTPGGIINLRTGAINPSDPAKLHTRVTSCTPDPNANQDAWLRFLADTFGDDAGTIGYLQRLVGYSAIGVIGPHILPFLTGVGGNGKGVFTESAAHVLGGYATTAPSSFLMAKKNPDHETEIARLAGARMVLCSEVNEEDRFDEARVKVLTGGDTITARFMYQDHFTFTPSHQLWLVGNHQPAVKSGGRAFWRRLRLVEFKNEVPADKIIDDLQGILSTQHGPAVLSWIIAGAVEFTRAGLQEPTTVTAATNNYAHEQDTVSRFLEDACRIGGGEQVQLKAAVLRAAYESWCTEAGEHPVTAKALGLALGRAGIKSKRTMSARMYLGISLYADENASSAWDAFS